MNINIIKNAQHSFNTLQGTLLQDVLVIINGPTTWTGTTNSQGKVKDTLGNIPELLYGSYEITTSKFGYSYGYATFIVPDTTTLTITMSLIKVPIDITITD